MTQVNSCRCGTSLVILNIMILLIYFLIGLARADVNESVDVQPGDRLKINCYNGKLQLIEEPSTTGLKITGHMIRGQKNSYSNSNITVQKKDGEININCELSQSDILKLTQKENMPDGALTSFDIVVHGKAVPTDVNWKWGDISVKNWSKQGHIVLERGHISSRECSSELRLNLIEGQLTVQNQKGRVQVESYDSKVLIENFEGPVSVSNFMGTTKLQKITGDMKYKSRKGIVEVIDSEGSFNFDNDVGKVFVTKLKGPVEGTLEQGILEARLIDPAHLRVKSKTGVVDIIVPKTSGARVDLVIGDGQFKVPPNLKTEYLSNLRTIRGELQGAEKGLISVHSDTGKIFLKTN